MPDMSGKNGLITAAGDGIGRASALAFARAGARVLLMDIAADGVEQTAQLVRDAGGVAEVMVGDASDEDFAAQMVARVVELWGALDFATTTPASAPPPRPSPSRTAACGSGCSG